MHKMTSRGGRGPLWLVPKRRLHTKPDDETHLAWGAPDSILCPGLNRRHAGPLSILSRELPQDATIGCAYALGTAVAEVERFYLYYPCRRNELTEKVCRNPRYRGPLCLGDVPHGIHTEGGLERLALELFAKSVLMESPDALRLAVGVCRILWGGPRYNPSRDPGVDMESALCVFGLPRLGAIVPIEDWLFTYSTTPTYLGAVMGEAAKDSSTMEAVLDVARARGEYGFLLAVFDVPKAVSIAGAEGESALRFRGEMPSELLGVAAVSRGPLLHHALARPAAVEPGPCGEVPSVAMSTRLTEEMIAQVLANPYGGAAEALAAQYNRDAVGRAFMSYICTDGSWSYSMDRLNLGAAKALLRRSGRLLIDSFGVFPIGLIDWEVERAGLLLWLAAEGLVVLTFRALRVMNYALAEKKSLFVRLFANRGGIRRAFYLAAGTVFFGNGMGLIRVAEPRCAVTGEEGAEMCHFAAYGARHHGIAGKSTGTRNKNVVYLSVGLAAAFRAGDLAFLPTGRTYMVWGMVPELKRYSGAFVSMDVGHAEFERHRALCRERHPAAMEDLERLRF